MTSLRFWLPLAGALLLVALASSAAPKAGPVVENIRDKNYNVDKTVGIDVAYEPGVVPVVRGADVFLAVAKSSAHVRLLFRNPDGTFVSIDETTRADRKTILIMVTKFEMPEAAMGRSLIMKPVGKVSADDSVLRMLSLLRREEHFQQYNYQTNTCGVAALRMLKYLGLDAEAQIEWLAPAMHDFNLRADKNPTDHSHRIFYTMAGRDAFRWRAGDTNAEEVKAAVPDIIRFASLGMMEALESIAIEKKPVKSFLFAQRRTSNPKKRM